VTDVVRAEKDTSKAAWEALEGPQPIVLHPDDAAHWVGVYEELVATMDRMVGIARMRASAQQKDGGLPSQEARELELLTGRAAFFRERLNWWSERSGERASESEQTA